MKCREYLDSLRNQYVSKEILTAWSCWRNLSTACGMALRSSRPWPVTDLLSYESEKQDVTVIWHRISWKCWSIHLAAQTWPYHTSMYQAIYSSIFLESTGTWLQVLGPTAIARARVISLHKCLSRQDTYLHLKYGVWLCAAMR